LESETLVSKFRAHNADFKRLNLDREILCSKGSSSLLSLYPARRKIENCTCHQGLWQINLAVQLLNFLVIMTYGFGCRKNSLMPFGELLNSTGMTRENV
jgi:hypothetical protein